MRSVYLFFKLTFLTHLKKKKNFLIETVRKMLISLNLVLRKIIKNQPTKVEPILNARKLHVGLIYLLCVSVLFIVHFRVLFGKNYKEGIWVSHEKQTQHSMVGDGGHLMTRTIPTIYLFYVRIKRKFSVLIYTK